MDLNAPRITDAVINLLSEARLPAAQLASRLETATSVGYWQRLNPNMSLKAEQVQIATPSLDHDTLRVHLDRLESDGYFHTEPLIPLTKTQEMADCVEVLRNEGWPAVFAFVYDEFWAVMRTTPLVQLLSVALGPNYLQNSDIWCFYVASRAGASGWPPHTDNFPLPRRVTVWLPLTDATVENGCMYVIPHRSVPESLTQTDLRHLRTVERQELTALLKGTRALPARAGSLLGWDFQLIHWGSANCGGDRPRISLSVEFLAADAEPIADEHPLFEVSSKLPSFDQRLHSIGKSILAYHRFEPTLGRFRELAEKL